MRSICERDKVHCTSWVISTGSARNNPPLDGTTIPNRNRRLVHHLKCQLRRHHAIHLRICTPANVSSRLHATQTRPSNVMRRPHRLSWHSRTSPVQYDPYLENASFRPKNRSSLSLYLYRKCPDQLYNRHLRVVDNPFTQTLATTCPHPSCNCTSRHREVQDLRSTGGNEMVGRWPARKAYREVEGTRKGVLNTV